MKLYLLVSSLVFLILSFSWAKGNLINIVIKVVLAVLFITGLLLYLRSIGVVFVGDIKLI